MVSKTAKFGVVLNITKRYNSGTYKLSTVKLGENYLRTKRNKLHGVQGH